MTKGYNTDSDTDVEELEEGELLELPERDAVIIKKDVKYESNYKNMEELGKGKFGTVYKCQSKADGEILAAKFVRKTPSSKEEVTREIQMMNLLHHKRLIQLYDAYETQKEMVVIMELVTGGELFEKVVEEDNLTEKQVIRYMKQILYGVQHMHKRNMVHLDLKPENILCLGGGKPGYEQIKLIDFGMTRILKEGQSESALCGTPEFVAPEVITFNPITIQADMWSLGVITYVLLSGLSPFMGDDDNETLANVTSGEFDFEDDDEIFENLSDESKQFIEDLLILQPKTPQIIIDDLQGKKACFKTLTSNFRQRLTVDESLSHVWLSGGGSDNKINTSNLKKFIARRRWQRTMNTIKAVSRLAGGLSLFGKKAGAHGFGKGGFLEKVKQQQEKEEQEQKEKEKIEEKKTEEENLKKKEREENERKRKDEEQAAERKKQEAEKKKKEKEEAERKLEADRKKAEEERKQKAEERKRKQEADKKKADEERKLKEEAERKRKEEATKKKAELERKRNEEDERKRKESEEKKKKLETEKQQKEEAEKKRKELEQKKKDQEEKRKAEEIENEKKPIANGNIHNTGTDIAEIKRKEIEECNNPIEKKRLIDVERKRKRDVERARRQEERRHNAEIREMNKVNSDHKTVINIDNVDENQNIIINTDNNNNKNIDKNSNVILRTENSKENLKSSSSPLITRKFGGISPRSSPRSSPHGSPIGKKRDIPKAGGGVMNRIAAFQTGDIYWNKNNKK